METSRKRALGWGFAVVVALGLAAQAIRPSLGKPAGPPAEIAATPEVRAILQNRCYTCHSNEPRLAWFDQVAPVSWGVAKDVREARSRLNFSELGNKPVGVQRAELFEAVNMIQLGAMPLPKYLAVHRGAGVTPEELATLKVYLAPFAPAKGPTVVVAEAKPVVSTGLPAGPSLNGVPFPADYKQWRLISTTDRGDNGTLRIITGNEVAIKAVAERRVHPWPDGAMMAKIALTAVDDGHGHVTPGEFVQVEFMEKDAKKYAKTQGWGFARWRGADLKPYGKDAHFDGECTGCHAPMRDNDFVYTLPMARTGGVQ